jgi:hypothetical protein
MRRICFLVVALLLAATTLQAQEFITNLTVVGSKDYKEARDAVAYHEKRGFHCIEMDLNKGARGGYIYLLYTTQTKYGSPITDVYIKFGNDNFSSIITHEGRKYSLVARGGNPEFAGTCDGDLNYGAKGKYIYLYASWGSFTPSRGLTSITFNGNSSGAVGINGDASKPADLNSGAGGDYIYMHAEYKLREETAEISTEEALRAAVNYNNANILLANDIRLNSPLVVSKATNVTIDLNGHQLDRGMFSEFSSKPEGRAIVVDGKADLTVKDTGEGGRITGGSSDEGAGVWIGKDATFTILSGTISGNRSYLARGAGICNNGTLNMMGSPIVKGNVWMDDACNIYLPEGKTINVIGPFSAGSLSGIWSDSMGALTNGFLANSPDTDPAAVFFSDNANYGIRLSGGEAVQDPSAKETLLTTRFVAADGSEVTQYGVHKLSEIKNHTLYTGWYELDKDLTFTERLRVEGNVHLILADGRTLTDHMGINVPDGQTLTLYGQRLQTGTLNINLTEKSGWAGIGSYLEQSDTGTGDITINGGVINVTGVSRAAAIGSGEDCESGGSVIINNGLITATCSDNGTGIGTVNGKSLDALSIRGGIVQATGADKNPGIDNGPGVIEIYGGTVKASHIGSDGGKTTLNWSNLGDSIESDGYSGQVTLLGEFSDGTNTYPVGDVKDPAVLAGKKLVPNALYNIFIAVGQGGEVASSMDKALGGDTVTLTVTTLPGFTFTGITVVGQMTGTQCTLTRIDDRTYTFTMLAEPITVQALFSVPTDTVTYIDLDGKEQTQEVVMIDKDFTTLPTGWYAIKGNLTNNHRLVIPEDQDVNIILCDDANFSKSCGVTVPQSAAITIWGQRAGTGKWSITEAYNEMAGIGSEIDKVAGEITINGGTLDIRTGSSAAIGGGRDGDASLVTINGGNITVSSVNGAGIGRGLKLMATYQGYYAATITINGGVVHASSRAGAGIGASDGTLIYPGIININGGTIVAKSESNVGIGNKIATSMIINLNYEDFVSITSSGYRGELTLLKDFSDGTNLLKAGKISDFTKVNGKTLVAYGGKITLMNASDNSALIAGAAGAVVDVTLGDRTLWKDGSWNTLCLPFAIEDIKGTPLEGATVKTLIGASFIEGKLTFSFGESVTALEAGKPYIVMWSSGDPVVNPVFRLARIEPKINNVTTGDITFTGCFGPVELKAGDKSVLYVGADNKLFSPNENLKVNSCRAYFKLGDDSK